MEEHKIFFHANKKEKNIVVEISEVEWEETSTIHEILSTDKNNNMDQNKTKNDFHRSNGSEWKLLFQIEYLSDNNEEGYVNQWNHAQYKNTYHTNNRNEENVITIPITDK